MSQRIALIDYGSGNLRSAAKALERAAAESGIAASVELTSSPAAVRQADRIVLPGVGAFGQCAVALRSIEGMEQALHETVIGQGRPFLGVCVGMQLMAQRSYEHGEHLGLGWIPGDVLRIKPRDVRLKVPHMGWNSVRFTGAGAAHALLAGLPDEAQAYFVHSFHYVPEDESCLLATTHYGHDLAAIVGRASMIGVQFHPEKSQAFGISFLSRFLSWKP